MSDNPNLIDGRDDVAVNRTQAHETRYFVEHYIRTRARANTPEVKAQIEAEVRAFEPNRKVFRDELLAHLDAKWKLQKVR